MHGESEHSQAPRRAWVGLHLLQLVVSLWILLGGGYATLGGWLGRNWVPGSPLRRELLAAFGVVLFLRMTATALFLLKRRFAWGEAAGVVFGSGLYQLGFALLGVGAAAPLGPLDILAVVLFAIGSAFNTGSELQRRAFKATPQHAGQLYTGGLFALCRHPNYFGDCLWGLGWALLGRSPWSMIIVAIEVSGFAFSQVPLLDRYLESRYGETFREWARHTKRLIPFIY